MPAEQSDVSKVEKLLKGKNKALSELESREKLFRRMIKTGISTPDVSNFINKQIEQKQTQTLSNSRLRKAAMKSKLDDVISTIKKMKMERRDLKRELTKLLRTNKTAARDKLIAMKARKR